MLLTFLKYYDIKKTKYNKQIGGIMKSKLTKLVLIVGIFYVCFHGFFTKPLKEVIQSLISLAISIAIIFVIVFILRYLVGKGVRTSDIIKGCQK